MAWILYAKEVGLETPWLRDLTQNRLVVATTLREALDIVEKVLKRSGKTIHLSTKQVVDSRLN